MDAKIEEYLKDAQESLRVTIEAVERLRNECEQQKAGEQGSAHGRIDLYLLPALKMWLESDSQIGSLRDLDEELEQGWTWLHREMTGEREFKADGTMREDHSFPDPAEAHQEHLAGAECQHEMVRVDNDICEACNQKVEWKEDHWELVNSTSEEYRNVVCQHPEDRVEEDWCYDCAENVVMNDDSSAYVTLDLGEPADDS